MTLTEFLLERIAEDEAEMELAASRRPFDGKARWLAECATKRRVVELHQGHHECVGVKAGGRGTVLVAHGYQFANDPTLALLALPYDYHPDYDESWRPRDA